MFDDFMAIYVLVVLYILIVVCCFVQYIKIVAIFGLAFLDGRFITLGPRDL
jgi:hypothetical protein